MGGHDLEQYTKCTAQPLHGSQIINRGTLMNGSNIALVFAPIAILVALMPGFEASSFPNIIKGSVIGLYLGISLIGLLKIIEDARS